MTMRVTNIYIYCALGMIYTILYKPYKPSEIGSVCFLYFVDEVTELHRGEITCVKSHWIWSNIFSQPHQVLVVLFCMCCQCIQ